MAEKRIIAETERILEKEEIITKAKGILGEGYDGVIGLRRR